MQFLMDKFTDAEIKQALSHLKELHQECEDGTLDQHLSPSLGIAIDALADELARRAAAVADALQKSGEYKIEWIDAETIRLTPIR